MSNAEVVSMTTQEKMMNAMSVSWDQIDTFFNNMEGTRYSDTKSAWAYAWLRNKAHIFEAWGERLRIEKEVELSLAEKDVRSEMRAMIERLRAEGKVSEVSLGIISIAIFYIPYEDVLENKLSKKVTLFNINFGAGMKVSKMLGRLILDDKEKYEVQTAFSISVQSFKATGVLVMSIDPMDILCMSFNPDSEWRSCHNIQDGEFRSGAISYVVDSSSFIGYVYRRSAESNLLPGVEIPNKLWRQMGYFSEDMSFAALSTHYPSTNKNNRKTLVSLMTEVMGSDKTEHGFIDADLLDYRNLMKDQGNLHYNDLTQGRAGRAYMVDILGRTHQTCDMETFFGEVSSTDLKFYVGSEEVSSFKDDGYIRDSGSVDTRDEDGDDYDYDEDDDY